jgi:hypothetical protein
MQHLVYKVGSTRQAALQLAHRAVAFVAVAGALGNLQLGLQGGQRSAQFVCGIGREPAFRFKRVFDPLEETVEGFEQGADFQRAQQGYRGWCKSTAADSMLTTRRR